MYVTRGNKTCLYIIHTVGLGSNASQVITVFDGPIEVVPFCIELCNIFFVAVVY